MGKVWSLLFLMVPVLGVGVFLVAPAYGHWLPKDVSAHGHMIDHLFNFILWLTGGVFVATEIALFWFMWKYDAKRNPQAAKFTHGSHNVEVAWTLLPAATLLFIAIYQMNAWAQVKIFKPDMPATVEVTARQFEWRIRYPGPDGKFDTRDDLFTVNDMHLPVGETVLIDLKSADVLHSFFLPHMRMKQDAVPGSKIPMWVKIKEEGMYDLVCAELCGWGHYKMKGRVTAQSREDFDQWLAQLQAEQERTQEPEKPEE
ncbi:MAG: cytochrome c oxidase subunit II [Planctomycetia bacterium]|nr:cytochrome c oxidase subunit II [Planctomycetia bacterium]